MQKPLRVQHVARGIVLDEEAVPRPFGKELLPEGDPGLVVIGGVVFLAVLVVAAAELRFRRDCADPERPAVSVEVALHAPQVRIDAILVSRLVHEDLAGEQVGRLEVDVVILAAGHPPGALAGGGDVVLHFAVFPVIIEHGALRFRGQAARRDPALRAEAEEQPVGVAVRHQGPLAVGSSIDRLGPFDDGLVGRFEVFAVVQRRGQTERGPGTRIRQRIGHALGASRRGLGHVLRDRLVADAQNLPCALENAHRPARAARPCGSAASTCTERTAPASNPSSAFSEASGKLDLPPLPVRRHPGQIADTALRPAVS